MIKGGTQSTLPELITILREGNSFTSINVSNLLT